MKKIFKDAKDKYVATNVVYFNGTDLKVFADSEYKIEMESADLWDACLKGVIVCVGKDSYVLPNAFKKETDSMVKLTITVGGVEKVLLGK